MPQELPRRIALVLGGGGLKGLAHIGVLRALEDRGVRPSLVAGTSIGALVAAAYASGVSLDEMERRAIALRKRDLFEIDHFSMIARRMRAPALYRAAPLDALVREIVPDATFRELRLPLLVNTVDLERGMQVVWGLPGLQDVAVADAVYASCALPGFFPPGVIAGRTCADGGVMDNLPALVASRGMDGVVGVDVGSTSLEAAKGIRHQGFAAIYMRAATMMMKQLQSAQLAAWAGPPLLLVRPAVWQFHWFSFAHTRQMIDAGYRAALDCLDRAGAAFLAGHGGVHPRRELDLRVDRRACTGCGLCATLAPQSMTMDADGKARAVSSRVEWSRAEGDFLHQCPVDAIAVRMTEGVSGDVVAGHTSSSTTSG